MLSPNYCTFEHENALLIIIRSSLVQRDLSFSIKKLVFFYEKKVIFLLFSPSLFESFQKKSFFFSSDLYEMFRYHTNVETKLQYF